MKSRETIASEYAEKLITYDRIINKNTFLINKYNGELEEKKRWETSFLKRKKENSVKSSKLDDKIEKSHKIWWYISMALIVIGAPILMVLAVSSFWNSWYLCVFAIINSLPHCLRFYKMRKYNRELDSIKETMTDDEEQKLNIDREMTRLRIQIDKLEQVNQITKEKADIIREFLDQLETQISLSTPQDIHQQQKVVPKQVSYVQPQNKKLKVGLC